jgi:Mg/Co/Ni transporter MgtE
MKQSFEIAKETKGYEASLFEEAVPQATELKKQSGILEEIGQVEVSSVPYIETEKEQEIKKETYKPLPKSHFIVSLSSKTAFRVFTFLKTSMTRFPWLFCNLITACIISIVIAMFENQISDLAVLAAIMPIVASMGGNAGTQSVAVSVRALANRDINAKNIWHSVVKEMLSCMMNGLLLGIIGGVILLFLYKQATLSMIFGLAIVTNFAFAGVWGSLIPISLDKAGLDPTISSSVFVTFLTDLLGFFIFLSLASVLLV